MIADRPVVCLAVFVQTSSQFADRIDSFGAFGPACLANFGSGARLFHALCLGHIRCFAAVSHMRHSAIGPGAAFTAPGQGDLAGTRIAPEYQAVLGHEFVGSHVIR